MPFMKMVKSRYIKIRRTMETHILKEAKKHFNNPEIDFRLLGGMSNYMYVIKDGNNRYTLRILGEHAEKFVWRHEEKDNIPIFESLGVTTKTIYFNEETGVKISQYVDGEILSRIDPLDHLESVSNILKTVHGSKVLSKHHYHHFERLDKYEMINDRLAEDYYTLKEELKALYDKHYRDLPQTLCHGDAQPSNFIISKDHAYLVDFEFAANNDPYYDIATFGNMNDIHAFRLLDVYLGRKASKEELKRLIYFRMFQCVQWYLVATFKHKEGMSETLKIPFDKAATNYIRLARKLKGDYDNLG